MRHKPALREVVIVADEPVPYRLAFREGGPAAKLTSPGLDRTMHARGGVAVAFESLRGPERVANTVDPFELQSVIAYLENQDGVRRELERQLGELLEDWDPAIEVGRGHAVWEHTKIAGVDFAPRRLATPDRVRQIKKRYKGKAAEVLRMAFDSADSRSSFAVTMMPEWAEHQLLVQFRDGAAMELLVEG